MTDDTEETTTRRYRVAARFPSLLLARRNVSRAKIRSGLAALAIAIGVFAIATVGATGIAFQSSALGTFEGLGIGQVVLLPGPAGDGAFSAGDVGRIERTVGEFGIVATSSETMQLQTRDGPRSVQVSFTEDPRQRFTIDEGALPPPANWDRSAVVTPEFATEEGVTVGDRVTLVRQTPVGERERTYRVAAVLESGQSLIGGSIYLPLNERTDDRFSTVVVTTTGADEARLASQRIDDRFNTRKDRIRVFEFTRFIDLLNEITNTINRVLVFLGSISMIVAAIAIANTMLMATIRRREEIGVLRAVGYQRGDIVRVLLIEAGMIGFVGGLVGVIGAVGVTAIANAFIRGELLAFSPGVAFAYSLTQLGIFAAGVTFGVAISLVAGFYPAWIAANERPVDALRG